MEDFDIQEPNTNIPQEQDGLPTIIVSRYYLALFPNDFILNNLEERYNSLLRLFGEFNGNNQLNNIPVEFPHSIPRMILQSNDGALACDLAFDKIAIAWKNIGMHENFSVSQDIITSFASRLFSSVLQGRTLNRIGLSWRNSRHAHYRILFKRW